APNLIFVAINRHRIAQPEIYCFAHPIPAIQVISQSTILISGDRIAIQYIVFKSVKPGIKTLGIEQSNSAVTAKTSTQGFENNILIEHYPALFFLILLEQGQFRPVPERPCPADLVTQ